MPRRGPPRHSPAATPQKLAIHYSGILNVTFPPDRDTAHKLQLDQAGDSLFFERQNLCAEALFSINGIVSAAFGGGLITFLMFRS